MGPRDMTMDRRAVLMGIGAAAALAAIPSGASVLERATTSSPQTIADLLERVAALGPVGESTERAFAVTGEPYKTLAIVYQADNETLAATEESALVGSFWQALMAEVERGGTIYWRKATTYETYGLYEFDDPDLGQALGRDVPFQLSQPDLDGVAGRFVGWGHKIRCRVLVSDRPATQMSRAATPSPDFTYPRDIRILPPV